jgi:ankyrin repeat protein
MVKCLAIGLEADVNHADADGRTPLFFSAHMGHLSLVRLLAKDLGADVMIK